MYDVTDEEVDRLSEAGFIREIQYSNCLSNVVIVKKKTGKWHVCVHFTDLNKACLKDSFPTSNIVQLVDALTRYDTFSFLHTYSGCNQIKMDQNDEEKTAFVMKKGIYYYAVMPFRLRNAGATYQRFVSRLFERIIGRLVKPYIDDTIVKSSSFEQHLDHLAMVFKRLKETGIRLIPMKC